MIVSGSKLKRMDLHVRNLVKTIPLQELRHMSKSFDVDRRLYALMVMQKQAATRKLDGYFTLGCELIEDSNNDCRWQALILVSEYLESQPSRIWDLIKKHGVNGDADMRAGVATVLLEHLLGPFPMYRGRARRLAAKSVEFSDTLATCWIFPDPTRKLCKRKAITPGAA